MNLSLTLTTLKSKNWDFKKVDTKRMTHGIHKYPARMVPQMTTELLKTFSKKNDLVLDPFMGSGTVITEALVLKRKAIGSDLNPLARLIAEVRTTPISQKKLLEMKRFLEVQFREYNSKKNIKLGEELEKANIEYWFKKNAIKKIYHIKNSIGNNYFKPKEISFLKICFSMTIRFSSNLREKEYKVHRMKEEDLKIHNPNPFKLFFDIFDDYSLKLNNLYSHMKEGNIKKNVNILSEDARNLKKIKSNSIDFILTSPPYGDSRTTVAYGQFSRYPLLWLGMAKEKVFSLDEILLGGKKTNREDIEIKSKTLKETLTLISEYDRKRAKDTENFMIDLYLSIKEMGRVLKKGAFSCIVIGNRAVRTIRVPTDKIIREMCNDLSIKYKTTLYRNIPSKTMPTRSKFLINGKTKWIDTMSKESIVILQKS